MRMAASDLDELIRELRAAGAVWFNDRTLLKLERLIEIAQKADRDREESKAVDKAWVATI